MKWPKDKAAILRLSLCEEHFEAEQFMCPDDKGKPKPRKQIRKDAIPTLFSFTGTPKRKRRVLVKKGTSNTFFTHMGTNLTFTIISQQTPM
jgi:hypothetical protein